MENDWLSNKFREDVRESVYLFKIISDYWSREDLTPQERERLKKHFPRRFKKESKMGNDKSLGISSADYGLLYAAVMEMRSRLAKEKPGETELHNRLSALMDKIVYARVHHTPMLYDNK